MVGDNWPWLEVGGVSALARRVENWRADWLISQTRSFQSIVDYQSVHSDKRVDWRDAKSDDLGQSEISCD